MSQVYWFEKDKARRGCPCLFLDRDGVIVEEVDYLCRREDVRILNGAAELIDSARLRGWAIGLISNQAGIARGYYDWAAFGIVQEEVVERLGMGPSPFDFVVACASHPDAVDLFIGLKTIAAENLMPACYGWRPLQWISISNPVCLSGISSATFAPPDLRKWNAFFTLERATGTNRERMLRPS